MFIDRQNTFSKRQALTATAASTDIIDLGADRNIGPANLRLRVQVEEALVSAGATTLVAALETDDNAGFSSPTVLVQTGVVPKASLVAGYIALDVTVPSRTERYLRMNYTVATGPFTGGSISAFFVLDTEQRRDYPASI